jgi:hypothetical protein
MRATSSGNPYGVYGVGNKQTGEAVFSLLATVYPANNTDRTFSQGGGPPFRIDGNKYYIRPCDGSIRAGTYRLTFSW